MFWAQLLSTKRIKFNYIVEEFPTVALSNELVGGLLAVEFKVSGALSVCE